MRKQAGEIESMAELRGAIDEIDGALVELLAERLSHIDRAPVLKAREGIAANAPSRVADVLAKVRAGARTAGFEPEVAAEMWQVMIDAMIAREERVMGRKGRDG
ncbi:MAG: chorismate mutase [Rhodobacteraceae bacterium]|nr:MAG: chorismate mutase [Paracoccaceae bacterium]